MQKKDTVHPMKNFKALGTIIPLMVRLGLHSYDLHEPKNEFLRTFAAYYVTFIANVLMILSGSVFVYKHMHNFMVVSEPLLVIIGGLQMFGMFFSLGLNNRKVKLLQIEIQALVDEAHDQDVFNIYWNIEQKCQVYANLVFHYFWLHPMVFGGALLYAFYCIYVGNTDTSTWILNYKLSLPVDGSKISGWFWVWFASCHIGIPYSLAMISVMSYFGGCCYYIIGICEHFDLAVHSMDIGENTKNRSKTDTGDKRRYEIIDIVDLHNKIFEIFGMTADINSAGIFWLLPSNILFFSLSMYNSEHSSFDFMMVVFHVICITSSFFWPFLYCYFSSLTTNQISLIGDAAYDSNWFGYPPKYQKYMILIIARSQETIYFTGFNLMRCTLETFGKLLKTSTSYYVLFRSLSER